MFDEMKLRFLAALFACALTGCSTVRSASRKLLGLDSTAGDPDLSGDTFVAGVYREGRFDDGDLDAPVFAWSGTRIGARFSGTSAGVELDDAQGKNEFLVLVDGKPRSQKLDTKRGTHAYLLVAGLPSGTHEVTLHRLTEASLGETKFLGFRFGKGGRLLAFGKTPARRIEVIGDSISTGYGNEGEDKACHFSPQTENHYLTYGAITARAADALLVTTAWSGKGVFSNRGSTDPWIMPVLWKRTLPEREDSRWDFARYQPDVVVINLGTNDFAPENEDWSPFPRAYLAFVKEVRSRYPKASIFCALGPALSDHWPEGRSALTHARQGIEGAVAALRGAGDGRVYFVEFPVQTGENGYGCDWHPNVKTHELMADQLQKELRDKMRW
ncbi:MAG TPA: SGNH/GDSL hydrolase family protein [Polyangiaceae bacterium]